MRQGREEFRKLDDGPRDRDRPRDWDRPRDGDRGPDDCCDRPRDDRPEYHGGPANEEYLVREWRQSYERAFVELRVEILKEKIRKSWGKSLEKIAEKLDGLMRKDWELCQKEGDHSEEREKLVKDFAKFVLEAYNKNPKSKKRR